MGQVNEDKVLATQPAETAGETPDLVAGLIPDNWTDPLLTGPSAVIGRPPYDGRDIERLLSAIKKRIQRRGGE